MISFWIISVRFRLISRRNDCVLKTGTNTVFTLLLNGARIEYPQPESGAKNRAASRAANRIETAADIFRDSLIRLPFLDMALALLERKPRPRGVIRSHHPAWHHT